jgi:ATP-dependent Clp endopeptidase proteolytic subunit ClpP
MMSDKNLEEDYEIVITPENDEEGLEVKVQQDPFFVLSGGLDDENVEGLLNFLIAALEHDGEIELLKIYMSTPGGCSDSAHGLTDLMVLLQDMGKIIETFAVGTCMSAGVMLVSCGTHGFRKATRFTRFMIHPVIAGLPAGTAPEIEVNNKETQRHQKDYVDKLVMMSSMEDKELLRKKLKKIMKKNTDYFFSAEEALELGFIDIIV